MKRVVRNRVTSQYLQLDGSWCSQLEEAYSFLNTLTALETVQNHKLYNVEMILMIHEQPTAWDIVLPLRPRLLSDAA